MKNKNQLKFAAVAASVAMLLSVSLASPQAFKYQVSRLQPAMPELTDQQIAWFERMHAEGRMTAEQLATNKARAIEHAQRSANGTMVTGTVTVMATGNAASETSPVPTNKGTFKDAAAYRTDEISLTVRNGKYFVAPAYAANGSRRYSKACAQLVLANHWSPMLQLEEVREGGKVRVYSAPLSVSPDSTASSLRQELTVEFADPGSTRIVSVATRFVDQENDIPVRRYEISGQFGSSDYVVTIIHLNRDGSEREVETLTFAGTTDEYFSLNSIPIGATVVDSRGGDAVSYAWSGELPDVSSDSGFPVAIWFAAVSVLCLAAGVFFWRRR